jgi:hypothetical protein
VTEAATVAPTRALQRRPLYLMLAITILPVLVLIGVGLGLALGVRGTNIQVLALALIMLGVALIPLMLDFGRLPEQRHLLLFFLMLSWMAFFVFPVFTTYFFADVFLGERELGLLDLEALHPADIARGQTVVLVGLLAMLLGYAIPLGRLVPGGVPRPRRDWSMHSALIVALLTIPLGWMITLSWQFGLLPSRVGSGFVGWLGTSTYFGIALLMLVYLRYRSFAALALLGLLIPPTMAFNYMSGSRGIFFAPLAVTIIAYIVVKRRIQYRWIAVAFVTISIFYPVVEFQRQVILQGNTRGMAWALMRPVEVVTKTTRFVGSQNFGAILQKGTASMMVRFDGLGIASVIVRDCPSRVPFQGGWTIGQIFVSYIPRLVWKNKPLMTSGGWVTEKFAGGPGIMSSTGATWIGEFWFNFGWPGIVLGMLVIGIFFRVLHEMLFRPNAVMPAQMMAVITLFTVPPTLGGALIGPINGVVFGSMPLVLMHLSVRVMSGTVRPAAIPDPESEDLVTDARARV